MRDLLKGRARLGINLDHRSVGRVRAGWSLEDAQADLLSRNEAEKAAQPPAQALRDGEKQKHPPQLFPRPQAYAPRRQEKASALAPRRRTGLRRTLSGKKSAGCLCGEKLPARRRPIERKLPVGYAAHAFSLTLDMEDSERRCTR